MHTTKYFWGNESFVKMILKMLAVSGNVKKNTGGEAFFSHQ